MIDDNILSTYIELAASASKHGSYVLADKMIKAALDESRKLGEKTAKHALILATIASTYAAQRQYKKAESFYKMALCTYQNIFGTYNKHTSTVLDSLAELALLQGKLGRAEQFFVRAQRSDEKTGNTNQRQIAIRFRRLAYVYFKRSKLREAEAALRASKHLQS